MQHFEHQAMATQFYLTIAQEDKEYAQSAAMKCFQRLDELELLLSRFVADSDISRINKLSEGDQIDLDYETWEVMKMAIQVNQWTGGTFDIGVAEHMNIHRATKEGILNEFEMTNALEKAQQDKMEASLYLDPDQPRFYCHKKGMKFDLGGIGKGYALDQLSLIMEELGISNYNIDSGDSTVFAKGKPAPQSNWEHKLSTSKEQHTVVVKDLAISASGTFHQGHHIFDPRSGKNDLDTQFERIWVASEKAAFADAFSTGLFLMDQSEVQEILRENS